ncbi:MAG: sulfotransferase, partial [Myxococcales bacterium]|nr:sulfotransferase [Myxococcales bacterium]
MRFPEPPIIIGGCGRSGTTLVASILSCHPRIAVVGPETRAFAAGAYPSDRPPRPFTPFRLGALEAALARAPGTAIR